MASGTVLEGTDGSFGGHPRLSVQRRHRRSRCVHRRGEGDHCPCGFPPVEADRPDHRVRAQETRVPQAGALAHKQPGIMLGPILTAEAGGGQGVRAVINGMATPAFVMDEGRVVGAIDVVKDLVADTGCHLLYALKAQGNAHVLRVMRGRVEGFAASSLFEAELARSVLREEGSVHITTPNFRAYQILGDARLTMAQRYLTFLPGDVIAGVIAFHARERGGRRWSAKNLVETWPTLPKPEPRVPHLRGSSLIGQDPLRQLPNRCAPTRAPWPSGVCAAVRCDDRRSGAGGAAVSTGAHGCAACVPSPRRSYASPPREGDDWTCMQRRD